MKRLILILTIIGGLIGIFGNILFFACGSACSSMIGTTSEVSNQITFLYVNAILSIIFSIIAMISGGIIYADSIKENYSKIQKYIALILLISSAIGLGLLYSVITVILIGISAIIALIVYIPELKKDINNDDNGIIKKAIIITSSICVVFLFCISLYGFRVIDFSNFGIPSQYTESEDVTNDLLNFIKTNQYISGDVFNKTFSKYKFKSIKIKGNIVNINENKESLSISIPNNENPDNLLSTTNVNISFDVELKNQLPNIYKNGDSIMIKGVLSKGVYDHKTIIFSSSLNIYHFYIKNAEVIQ